MPRAPSELARKGYACGRLAERRILAEELDALAEFVGTLVAFGYLDGREDFGELQGDLDEERAELVNRVRVAATREFRAMTRTIGTSIEEQK